MGWIYAPAESKDGIWLWKERKAGSGPAGKHGPTSGSMIPDPGSISRETEKTGGRSFLTTPAITGDKNLTPILAFEADPRSDRIFQPFHFT